MFYCDCAIALIHEDNHIILLIYIIAFRYIVREVIIIGNPCCGEFYVNILRKLTFYYLTLCIRVFFLKKLSFCQLFLFSLTNYIGNFSHRYSINSVAFASVLLEKNMCFLCTLYLVMYVD